MNFRAIFVAKYAHFAGSKKVSKLVPRQQKKLCRSALNHIRINRRKEFEDRRLGPNSDIEATEAGREEREAEFGYISSWGPGLSSVSKIKKVEIERSNKRNKRHI